MVIVWMFCWLISMYCVYQGGRTLNDHVVALFVTLCMIVYLIWWFLFPDTIYKNLLLLGPISMTFLFVVLVRRKEVSHSLVYLGLYLSQIAYALSLFGWGIYFPWILFAHISEIPLWNHWVFGVASLCTVWGVVYTYRKYEHCNIYRLGTLGIRVVQISDIHVSPTMTREHVQHLIEKVNALEPDILLATGDFVMPFSEDNHEYLYSCLQQSIAPVYACLGNHDLPVREKMIRCFEDHGMTMLVDTYDILVCKGRRIWIGGLDFLWKGAQEHTQKILQQWMDDEDCDAKILLIHDPRYFGWLPSIFDLVCAGHTHGGQFGLNALGFPVSLLRPLGVYDQGFFQKDTMKLYVHKGNWHTGLPPRIGIAAEIAVFDL